MVLQAVLTAPATHDNVDDWRERKEQRQRAWLIRQELADGQAEDQLYDWSAEDDIAAPIPYSPTDPDR